MTFADSIKTCFSKYTTFTGRADRSEYWWFVLFIMMAGFVSALLHPKLYIVLLVAVFLPALAVQCRRLRDAGLSPWFVLMGMIPLAAPVLLVMCILPSKLQDNRYADDSPS